MRRARPTRARRAIVPRSDRRKARSLSRSAARARTGPAQSRADHGGGRTACAAVADQAVFPEAHLDLGQALEATGDLEAATAAYRTAIDGRPDGFPAAHVALGSALFRTGDLDEAVDALQTAISQNPRSPRAHFELGRVLESRGDLASAVDEFETAIASRGGIYADAYLRSAEFESARKNGRRDRGPQCSRYAESSISGSVLRSWRRSPRRWQARGLRRLVSNGDRTARR